MKKLIFSIIGASMVFTSASAFAFSGGEQDCTKCHSLGREQAGSIIRGLIPDTKIIDVLNAPIRGLWEIRMESGGRKGLLYIDYSKKKIIAGGNIFDIATRTNYTKESLDEISKVDTSSFPYENSLVMGDKSAKHRVVVFDDPE